MSDQTSSNIEVLTQPIGAEELRRFIAAKVTNLSCEACGARDWGYETAPDGTVFSGSFPDRGLESYIPVFHLNCKNCGLFRTFSTEAFRRWRGDING